MVGSGLTAVPNATGARSCSNSARSGVVTHTCTGIRGPACACAPGSRSIPALRTAPTTRPIMRPPCETSHRQETIQTSICQDSPRVATVGSVKQGDVTRATVRAVAAAAGVSIATVSRVLNDRGNVAPDTRELVERAMAELGGPGPQPRRSARPIPGSVFVRCPYLLTDYFGIIVSRIAETLELHRRAMVHNAGE